MPEAYCLRCRAMRTIANPVETKLKNGRRTLRGSCPTCKAKLSRIVKN